MGKKKLRTKQTSNGERSSVAKGNHAAPTSVVDKAIMKQSALMNGKNVWMTIDNPDKQETAKRRIRVKVLSKDTIKQFTPMTFK